MARIGMRLVRSFTILTFGMLILFMFFGCESYRTDKLIRDLEAKEPDVRLNAATELADTKDPRVILPLIAALKDKDRYVSERATESLAKLGPLAVEPLIAILQDPKAASRLTAARILGKIQDARSIDSLAKALGDPEASLAQEAREALLSVLLAALRDGRTPIRLRAAKLLQELPDPKAVIPLIAALRDSDANVRQRVAIALGDIGSQATEALVKLLGDSNPEMRRVAAEQLGRIRPPEAVEPLLKALRDPERNVRWWSAWALGEIGDFAEKPLRGLVRDPDTEVQHWAKEALNKINGIPFDPSP